MISNEATRTIRRYAAYGLGLLVVLDDLAFRDKLLTPQITLPLATVIVGATVALWVDAWRSRQKRQDAVTIAEQAEQIKRLEGHILKLQDEVVQASAKGSKEGRDG